MSHNLIFVSAHQALHCKNIQKARELWDSIMTKGNAKYANMWLEYYNLERYVNQCLGGWNKWLILKWWLMICSQNLYMMSFLSLSVGLMETLFTVGKLSTEQSSAPQITPSTWVKSCSRSRGWRVSPNVEILKHNIKQRRFSWITMWVVSYRFSGGLGRGCAEDRDPAEQD